MEFIFYCIVIFMVFSAGFIVGTIWNYAHTINKQIERIDKYLEEENKKFEAEWNKWEKEDEQYSFSQMINKRFKTKIDCKLNRIADVSKTIDMF